jgi:hypothetical protein
MSNLRKRRPVYRPILNFGRRHVGADAREAIEAQTRCRQRERLKREILSSNQICAELYTSSKAGQAPCLMNTFTCQTIVSPRTALQIG